jgi:hypothetical protein
MSDRRRGSATRRLGIFIVATLLSVLVGFVLYHRLSVELPASGGEVRAGYRPATELETLERPSSVATLLRLHGSSGSLTTAWLRVPWDLDPDYDILLTYVGHQAGRKILDLVPERNDVVLLGMQYAAEYRRDTWRQKLALPSTLRRATHDTVAGGMLALAELERRGFDLDRLTVLGVSLGSFFAVLHGAYDDRVPRVLVIHGGGNLRWILTSYFGERGQPWAGRLAGALAYLFLGPLDSVHHVARIAPRDFTMIAARGDGAFPERSARALYSSARAPKAIAWTEGSHVRSGRPDIIADLVTQIGLYLDGDLEFDEREQLAAPADASLQRSALSELSANSAR